jgi:hypothetical protein
VLGQVDLAISAKNLVKLDVMSPSDPLAVLYEIRADGQAQEVGRTEVICKKRRFCATLEGCGSSA